MKYKNNKNLKRIKNKSLKIKYRKIKYHIWLKCRHKIIKYRKNINNKNRKYKLNNSKFKVWKMKYNNNKNHMRHKYVI